MIMIIRIYNKVSSSPGPTVVAVVRSHGTHYGFGTRDRLQLAVHTFH